MTRFNYRIDKDPQFPVGVDTEVHNRRRTTIIPLAGTAGFAVGGAVGMTATSPNAVTQATNKSTGVTLNKLDGAITMNNAALGAGAEVSFTVTNSTVAASDVPVVAIKSGATAGAYGLTVDAVASGSFQITVTNLTAGSLGEAIVISFVVIKPYFQAIHPVNAGGTSGLSASAGTSSTVGEAVNIRTGNGSGDSAVVLTPLTTTRRDWDPDFVARVSTSASLASIRFWIGMFSGDPSAAANLNALHGAAFGYDTGVDGTAFWAAVTGDGAATTRRLTTVPIVISTTYDLRIKYNSVTTSFDYYIDGNLVTSIGTNLPTATQLMGIGATVTTLTTAVKQMNLLRLSLTSE